jgi:hypothetical protein
MVPKAEPGTWRMCIDYRKLNEVTIKDRFPLPNIQDIHHSLRGSLWFSVMDADTGFHQIVVDIRDRHKLAFVTKWGTFTWNVLPMGISNGPATFQKFMESAIGNEGGLHNSAFVYVDDIIVHSVTFEEHLIHLRRLFERLRAANVTLKAKKCSVAQQSLKFLGFIADGEGIRADPEKVEAIKTWKTPKTLKQVQRFLGAANWLRDTVPHFADLAHPLYEMQKKIDNKKKTQRFKWGDEQEKAFKAIKRAVMKQTLLHHPDFNKEFHVDVDASDKGR